jgi:hypothetical protein
MTIHAHQHQTTKRWLLGRNRRERFFSTGFGERQAMRVDFDGYWSGDKWVRGIRNAALFDSEAAAYQDLESNLARIEAATSRKTRC